MGFRIPGSAWQPGILSPATSGCHGLSRREKSRISRRLDESVEKIALLDGHCEQSMLKEELSKAKWVQVPLVLIRRDELARCSHQAPCFT